MLGAINLRKKTFFREGIASTKMFGNNRLVSKRIFSKRAVSKREVETGSRRQKDLIDSRRQSTETETLPIVNGPVAARKQRMTIKDRIEGLDYQPEFQAFDLIHVSAAAVASCNFICHLTFSGLTSVHFSPHMYQEEEDLDSELPREEERAALVALEG